MWDFESKGPEGTNIVFSVLKNLLEKTLTSAWVFVQGFDQ